MQPLRFHCRFRLILLLVFCGAIALPAAALALSPRDLIVVYNRNYPHSRGVALYYAKRRHVPLANLVGVAVSTREDMSRREFDDNLVPPVREMVKKLIARGRTPAILLVYGIPLRVGGVPFTRADRDFKELANRKLHHFQKLVLPLARQLDRLTPAAPALPGKPVWKGTHRRLTYPPKQTLTLAYEASQRATAYLQKAPADAKNRSQIQSLLIRLAGISRDARALMAGTARRWDRRLTLRQRELLGLSSGNEETLKEGIFRGIMPATAQKTAAAMRATHGLLGEMKFWYEAQQLYDRPQTLAAVDSELTLLIAGPYQKMGWLPNPFYLGFNRLGFINAVRARTVMVCRLDGPTPAIAKRLVDDALAVEKTGLTGTFYIDARGLGGKAIFGNYTWYDHHLIHLYDLVKEHSHMKVVLNKKPTLFPPGSCPDTALYCGWYSLAKYIPAFTWNRGSVGFHVASAEATTLKRPGSQVWCKRMLEEGVAATLGPVAEPYLQSFPLPDQFFPLLMTGRLPLLEVYFATLPQISWMQILIGDPLYCPFKHDPAFHP